jgi:hypothetical protein
MAYVKSFKSFQNAEDKASSEIKLGANPVIAEQAAPTPATPTPTEQPVVKAQPAVESDPSVIAARAALATATANRDRAIAAKSTELEKLKSDQSQLVNNSQLALNNALQKAATAK